MNPMRPPTFEHLFSYQAQLRAPEIIGPVPEGIRVNFYVTGGTIDGPRLRGTILPVGGDWLTIRRDGIGVLDVRATLRAADATLIFVAYQGLGDLGPEGYEKFLQGETPPTLSLRTTPSFRSSAPQYQWLHRVLCVSTGVVDFERSEVRYDVFAVG